MVINIQLRNFTDNYVIEQQSVDDNIQVNIKVRDINLDINLIRYSSFFNTELFTGLL